MATHIVPQEPLATHPAVQPVMTEAPVPPIVKPTLPGPIAVSVHGVYEDAIIEGLRTIQKVMDAQPPEVRIELWKRWLEFTAPLHNAAVEASKGIGTWLAELLSGGGK